MRRAERKVETRAENPVFSPRHGENFWYLSAIARNLPGDRFFPVAASSLFSTPQNPVFRTEAAAMAWGEAVQVMLELRAQPGVVPYSRDAWALSHDEVDFGVLSPSFASRADAANAQNAVGADRMLAAARTLAWGGGQ